MVSSSTTAIRDRGSLRVARWHDLLVKHPIRAAYSRDGAVVEDTLRLWGPGRQRADPVPEWLENDRIVQVCDDEVIWGGYLSTHYGHFLTESASRLWPALPGGEMAGRPVVFVAPRRRPSFVSDWLAAFGVVLRELPPDGIVHFRNIYVPEPAWRLNAWIAPEIRDIHLRARQQLTVPSTEHREILWLSRSALDPSRLAYDECLLEWLLRDYVSFVWPEKLGLGEQVSTVEGSSTIAGIAGSAFHTLLLSRVKPRCLYLGPTKIASAYVAQGQLLSSESSFVRGLEPMPVKDRARGRFPGDHRVMIPEVLRELVATVLPGLAKAPDAAAILGCSCKRSTGISERNMSREAAIAMVAHNPYSVEARRRLGEIFEADGNAKLAHEQYLAITRMSDGDGKSL